GFVGAVPLFWLLNQPSALFAQFGQLGLMLIIGLYGGTLPAFLVEAAPSQVRCTAVSLGYNICLGVIGGVTTPLLSWVGRTNRRRDCAGVPDHGSGGRHGRGANALSRNLPGPIRRRYF